MNSIISNNIIIYALLSGIIHMNAVAGAVINFIVFNDTVIRCEIRTVRIKILPWDCTSTNIMDFVMTYKKVISIMIRDYPIIIHRRIIIHTILDLIINYSNIMSAIEYIDEI